MTGYVLLAIELAAILVVLVGLALFLGWVLGKRSARAKLAAEQETRSTRPTPELEAMAALKDDEKEPVSLASRAVPVEAQPAASQPPSPIAVASTPDSRPKSEVQPVSIPSPFAPDPSLYAGPSASTDPSARGVPAEAKPAEAKPAGEPQPDLLNDHTVSDESTIDTHMIPRITGQTPTPTAAEPDPRLLEAETKVREAEARIEEANQRALEAEVKAQEAEAKIEEAGQQVTQADLRVSEAEARAAEAEARAQQVDRHISDAEQARRQVVELEERINKQEIDMARLENRATAAWDKTMPNLIERIESLEDDLSQARREAAELQALLAAERDQAAPAPAVEQTEQAERPEQPEVPRTEIIREEPWQTIGPGAEVTQETPIAFASSVPDEDAEGQSPQQTGEPVDEAEPDEEARNDEEPEDEKTPDEEAAVEEEPGDEEEPEVEEEVRAPEQLAPTEAVEHEVELPAPNEKTKDQEDENQEDHQEDENQEETTDLSALTDTGSFAKLVAPGPAPEDPTPMNLPETEHLVPTAPVYPVTAHHDDATIPDIPRITAPIAQPFGAEEDASGWRRTMTPDTSQPKVTSSSSEPTDLLIDETEVDEVPVIAGLPEPGPVAEPSVNAGHIVAPQFGMAGQHDGVPRNPLDPKGNQLSISLEEDYTLVDPIDESIAVMDDLGEEFPVGVGIPPEDRPRIR